MITCKLSFFFVFLLKFYMKSAAFTGHRPNKLNGYEAKANKKLLWVLREVIEDHINNKGVTTFINGLALGIDMWAARIIIKLKQTNPNLKLISAIPCRNHPSKWPKSSQDEWKFIVDNSDEVVLVTDEDYKPYHMQIRNEWMVDRGDYIIAVWDGSLGGTSNCVGYAQDNIKELTIINPKTLEITYE